MGLLKIDGGITSIAEVREALEQVRERFPPGDDGTDEFLKLAPFIQYGIPFGELTILLSGPIEDRLYREYDPIEKSFRPAVQSNELFYNYIRHAETVLEKGYSFLFWGANGSGKTLLAFLIMYDFIHMGSTAYYIHLKRYMGIFNDANYGGGKTDARKLLHHVYNCDLLVVDEMGKEASTTSNVVGELEHLLKSRITRRLPTILITNLDYSASNKKAKIESFAERYGNSICDLLLKGYRFINFSSANNYRLMTREEWEI